MGLNAFDKAIKDGVKFKLKEQGINVPSIKTTTPSSTFTVEKKSLKPIPEKRFIREGGKLVPYDGNVNKRTRDDLSAQ